ncbi:alpha-ketoglutarate-dependent 2-4-dichlorophenoxyacetate dioxygenase [Penicillium macrosclerotiorum]|uniref:alpha-ketoglutarate-dependent 2-4-dichlorophenoxyacetate dioxygenase n=1 Tax=Penicillium macrosclerotiorum TaxID=303699 RepID=UPI002548EF33|nr:alpha-ketoglutarate-dependent 2-4-dichlorophenoxyacetate dioxygenase [Penicillium macrosclerotiorum]KAJ5676045.1 alpha-ketoglutarate-dependent 2-4-dichlorophenoxyacetate dioxygenase [Penicillium macrosclerotiorum]
MPGLSQPLTFEHITVTELHPTFGAEVSNVDFSRPIEDEVFQEIRAAIVKYGVCVFRNTGLDDARHVAFAAQFGELDDVTPYLAGGRAHRLSDVRLFDVGNIELDGTVFALDNIRREWNKGNGLFHVDSSFNPRRAGYSLLRGHELPPASLGGETEFADVRTAFDDLPIALQDELRQRNYIAAHSLWHSRKVAAPATFADVDPNEYPMGRHRLLQRHEASGRETLYLAAHIHHIEGLGTEESRALFDRLFSHATQPRYVLQVGWKNPGDLILWDNTSVMHRAVGGQFEGQYRRDMRRATVHDGSAAAWGLNERSEVRQGLP